MIRRPCGAGTGFAMRLALAPGGRVLVAKLYPQSQRTLPGGDHRPQFGHSIGPAIVDPPASGVTVTHVRAEWGTFAGTRRGRKGTIGPIRPGRLVVESGRGPPSERSTCRIEHLAGTSSWRRGRVCRNIADHGRSCRP